LKNIVQKKKINKQKSFSIIGYTGVIPFILTVILIWFFDVKNFQKYGEFINLYAYLIFTFVGAIYWGLAFENNIYKRNLCLIISIIPVFLIISLEFFFYLSLAKKMFFMIFFLNLFLVLEFFLFKKKVIPKWFFLMRLKLNTLVTFLLTLIFIKFYNF